MAKLLFKLRDVPDDELQDIHELLENNNLDTYETQAGNWGISFPGLWLVDESRFKEARQLIDDYQAQRSQRLKSEWAEQKTQGQHTTLLQMVARRPLATLALVAFCVVVLYFSVAPFLSFLDTSN